MSRKKHILNFAASSGVSGGVKRVFTAPTMGTFTINPSAHFALIGDAFDKQAAFILGETLSVKT